jgi:formate dehydrogenase (NADP+) beta subunit
MRSKKIKAKAYPLEWYRNNVPCRKACPVDTDSGQYVQLIAAEKYEEAFGVARSPNPLASICGRVCAAPCEDACRRGAIDSPVTIRTLKRFLTERYGSESQKPNAFKSLLQGEISAGAQSPGHLGAFNQRPSMPEKKVAIIGSGPAGLGAAHDLALMGYNVTVFEAAAELGGMMRFGIPEYRLTRSVIAKEIGNIQSLGVKFKPNFKITSDYNLSNLQKDGFKAIFISAGTQSGIGLNIPGADLDGVIKAVDYLLNINKGYKINLGNNVLIIGGGSVALDAARTAIRGFYSPDEAIEMAAEAGEIHIAIDVARSARREGSINVHVASLESFAEMPAALTVQGNEELEEARCEGITFHPSRGPKQIIGKEGKVTGIELIDVESVFDAEGKFNPTFKPGSEKYHEFDSIILAIGQKADTSFLSPDDGIELTPRGLIKINPETMGTTAPGIYAGGDVAFGPRILIEAIANGKRAARSINEYLTDNSEKFHTEVIIETIPINDYCMPTAYEKEDRRMPNTIEVDRRTGISEVEEVFDETVAIKQAERCLQCHVETIYDAELCVLCNRCVDICPEDCLALIELDRVEIEGADTASLKTDLEEETKYSVMLKDHTKCIRCGLCAKRCPTGAWTMQRLNFRDVIWKKP